MFRKIIYLILLTALTGTLRAQDAPTPTTPGEADMYCSGLVTTQAPPSEPYVISGVESDVRAVFSQGNLVFMSKGSNQGVKAGDQFLVSRPVTEQLSYPWFKWQQYLLRGMGQTYADLGRIRVVSVQPNTATAEVVLACDYIQRGDLLQAFVERPAPRYRAAQPLDLFAPRSGKAQAMVVSTRSFGAIAGEGNIVYVNLGGAQGVKVGDYFRVFRFQDVHHESVYQEPNTPYKLFGFGGTPKPYLWSDLPREIVGEGIVLRVAPNASTVLVTLSQREIFTGDYVELE